MTAAQERQQSESEADALVELVLADVNKAVAALRRARRRLQIDRIRPGGRS